MCYHHVCVEKILGNALKSVVNPDLEKSEVRKYSIITPPPFFRRKVGSSFHAVLFHCLIIEVRRDGVRLIIEVFDDSVPWK
jgi:hypothetical protein